MTIQIMSCLGGKNLYKWISNECDIIIEF
jgi:hypothetical protein